jgi:hypothetical protein
LTSFAKVHHSVVESTVKEKLAQAREEWRSEEKEHVRQVRIKCDKEYHDKLEEVVAERLQEKKVSFSFVLHDFFHLRPNLYIYGIILTWSLSQMCAVTERVGC